MKSHHFNHNFNLVWFLCVCVFVCVLHSFIILLSFLSSLHNSQYTFLLYVVLHDIFILLFSFEPIARLHSRPNDSMLVLSFIWAQLPAALLPEDNGQQPSEAAVTRSDSQWRAEAQTSDGKGKSSSVHHGQNFNLQKVFICIPRGGKESAVHQRGLSVKSWQEAAPKHNLKYMFLTVHLQRRQTCPSRYNS